MYANGITVDILPDNTIVRMGRIMKGVPYFIPIFAVYCIVYTLETSQRVANIKPRFYPQNIVNTTKS